MTHFSVSVQKSALRILGYAVLMRSLRWGALVLVVAEVLGVLEGLVDRRKGPEG